MKVRIYSKSKKNKYIFGELLENKKADTLVVFSSGFSGGKNFPLFQNASNEFYKKGYSALHFNFFGAKKDMLQAWDMQFSVYAKELKNIFDSFSKRYSRFVLVGHSFGTPVGISFLSQHKQFLKKTELILWEPTLLPWDKKMMTEEFIFDKKKGYYKLDATGEIMNKIFYHDCVTLDTAALFGSLKKDTCIISAKGSADKDAQKYFSKLKNKTRSKFLIIKGTDHYFDGKQAQRVLFKDTLDFLNERTEKKEKKVGKKHHN